MGKLTASLRQYPINTRECRVCLWGAGKAFLTWTRSRSSLVHQLGTDLPLGLTSLSHSSEIPNIHVCNHMSQCTLPYPRGSSNRGRYPYCTTDVLRIEYIVYRFVFHSPRVDREHQEPDSASQPTNSTRSYMMSAYAHRCVSVQRVQRHCMDTYDVADAVASTGQSASIPVRYQRI